jgi:hypothetical protein
MPSRTFTRILDGEHVIQEANHVMSREQVLLAANTIDYLPGTAMGQNTTTKQWGPWNPNATDGTQNCRGFLFLGRKLSTGTQPGVVHCNNCVINGKKVTWNGAAGVTPTAAQITAAIASVLSLDATIGRGNVKVMY